MDDGVDNFDEMENVYVLWFLVCVVWVGVCVCVDFLFELFDLFFDLCECIVCVC